ncbi:ProP Permeases of the major facilitator superfamily [Pyrenophora tritici-repentis]|nr:ProP Permeases of the major facilitator superfamily [Pyrenophora tritici-repentis]KAF7451958.1 ProP Permease of the major facilitator superfamily [Pyrenophora tritici-repentis]KAI1518975.1 Major Facilitator Superprotein [Pyrenophora tritici-repentis]KAI1672526.1 Major Facilitator Superprotein [Pyrenophora tritici-repentis]KAI1686551.1 Major Facilitator Superprotein [Pyrenophora tritici-repentis]
MGAIIVALFLSLFVSALDATIVATAAPTISRDLSSAAGYTWIGGAYLLANAASGPIWAKFSDIWGRKPIMLCALLLFFISSAVCATAKTMQELIIGRAFQGTAGGGLILLVHVCISDLFSLRQRSLLMGFMEGIWALAVYINLPISGIAALLILLFLDIKHEHTSFVDGMKALDWFGIFTFLGFTLMILFGLDFGGVLFPWDSAKVIALLVVGFVMIFAFIYSEAKLAKYPLMPMSLFKRRTNVAAFSVVFFHGFVFISGEYYMPLYFQAVLEASPLRSGLLLLPFIVTGAIAGVFCGVIMHKTGKFREIIWVGALLLTIGFGLFITFDAYTSTVKAVCFLMVGGLGSGILFEAPLIAIQSQVEQHNVASATATLSFIRNIGVSISTIVGGTIFQNSMNGRAAFLREAGLPKNIFDQLDGDSAMANVMLPGMLKERAWEIAAKQAFAYAMRNMWITYTVFAFLAFMASLFVQAAHLGTEHTETVTGLRKKEEEVVAGSGTATPSS